MYTISNNDPFIKNIRFAHLFRADTIPYSLAEVLKESYQSFINSDNYLKVAVLPDNVKIRSSQRNSKSGVFWSNSISMEINQQNDSHRGILDEFMNGLVVCCLETRSDQIHIYGNSDQPLSFLYKDVESTNPMDTIGYEITLKGDTYHSSKTITTVDFYNPSRLASWLATPL